MIGDLGGNLGPLAQIHLFLPSPIHRLQGVICPLGVLLCFLSLLNGLVATLPKRLRIFGSPRLLKGFVGSHCLGVGFRTLGSRLRFD